MSAFKQLRKDFNSFRRVLSLWFAFTFALGPGFIIVFGVTIINESAPSSIGFLLTYVLGIGATYVVYRWYPTVRVQTVWSLAIWSFVIFCALRFLNPTVIEQQVSGSLYYIIKAMLIWIAALSLGCVAVWTEWRESLPST